MNSGIVNKGQDISAIKLGFTSLKTYRACQPHNPFVVSLQDQVKMFFNFDIQVMSREGSSRNGYPMQNHIENIFILSAATDAEEIMKYMIKSELLDNLKTIDITKDFPDIKYEKGDTSLLHVVAKNNSFKVAKILLQNRVHAQDVINKLNKEDKSPLRIAIEKEHLKVLEAMVKRFLELKPKFKYDVHQLESLIRPLCTKTNWKEFLEALIPLYKHAIKSVKEWESPLSYAMRKSHYEMVAYLIKQLPDLSIKDNTDEYFPIHQVFTKIEDVKFRIKVLKKFSSPNDKESLFKKTGTNHDNILHFIARDNRKYTEEQLKTLKELIPKELINTKNAALKTPIEIAGGNEAFIKCFK